MGDAMMHAVRTAAPAASSVLRATPGPLLQRKCACGTSGSGGSCAACSEEQGKLQRSALEGRRLASIPPSVHRVVSSPGTPLDPRERAVFEPRFGFDFGRVRIHADGEAAESARAVHARAYTAGRHVTFGHGEFAPATEAGRRLLAHELAHVVQQGGGEAALPAPLPAVSVLPGGGRLLAVAAPVPEEPAHLEQAADQLADSVLAGSAARSPAAEATFAPRLARATLPLPTPVPLCGKSLTHIEVLPPRTKPLGPCLPQTVPVTRINMVGRDLTVGPPGILVPALAGALAEGAAVEAGAGAAEPAGAGAVEGASAGVGAAAGMGASAGDGE